MLFNRQYDYNNQLGTCANETISSAGCFIVSLANMANMDPIIINNKYIKNKVFTQGCLLLDKVKAAEICNLKYSGHTKEKPNHLCIAESNDGPSAQHFFIYNPKDDTINDPLSKFKGWEPNKYNIASYRLFKNESEIIPEKIITNNVYDSMKKNERIQFNISQTFFLCGEDFPEVKNLLNEANNILRSV